MAYRSTTSARLRAQSRGEGFYAKRDVAKQTFGYGKWFVGWSYFNVLYSLLMTTTLHTRWFIGSGWLLTPAVILSCLLQVALGNSLFKLPTRVPWTVFGLFLFYAYAMTTGMMANAGIAREVQHSLGWATMCLLFYAATSLSVIQATFISEKYRELVKWTVIFVAVASGLVGLAQNFNIFNLRSFFPGLEKQPDGIYRPTGLTDYPSQLGFQGMMGMAILGAPLYFRNLKWWEWGGVCFFALVILSAQYRSMYYAGIGLCLVSFGYMIFRRDRPQSMIFALVAVCLVALPLVAFPSKFAYGLRGAKDDPALRARQLAWKEAEPAQMIRPLTGIGPDPSLILATGNAINGDKYSTTAIDNLYITTRTCYGWVGVALAGFFVITTFGGLLYRLLLGSRVAASWAVASLLTSCSILIFSLTGNSVVYTSVGCTSALVFSLTSPTWREDAEAATLTDQFIRLRTTLAKGLRNFGINIG